jgi:hypothetical protein
LNFQKRAANGRVVAVVAVAGAKRRGCEDVRELAPREEAAKGRVEEKACAPLCGR